MAKYQAVPNRSQLTLEGQSSLHPIRTTVSGVEGYLEADVQPGGKLDLSTKPTGRLRFAVTSLKTGNDLYDLEMKRRLDPQRYPYIDAEVRELRATGQPGRYHVVGTVSLHGTTRPSEGDITITQVDDQTIELRGEQTFDVRDFGLQPPQMLMLKVHPDVKVALQATARRVD